MKKLGFIILFASCAAMAQEEIDCTKALTTMDVNQCMQKELLVAQKTMDIYLAKSIERYSQDEVSIKSITKSQEAWLKYREEHCNAVYDTWRDGTIRGTMALECKLKLTHQRTKVLWESFLTYMDSTPPLLPEPKLQN